jgi:hypothetical protein
MNKHEQTWRRTVSQQDYDFFATGPKDDGPVVPPPPPAPTRHTGQFGGAVDPEGRPLNQFGTPIGEAAVPVGPSAAPGYGAVPVAAPGLNSSWSGPALHPAHAHAAPVWGAPQAPAYGPVSGARPGTVLAAGVIAIVQGAFAVIVGLLGLAVAGAMDSGTIGDGSDAIRGVTGIVRIIMFVVLLIGVGYVVAGAATVAGKRWAAVTLLVVEGLGLLIGLIGMFAGSTQSAGGTIGQLLDLLVPAAVLILLLVPVSRAWLRRR